MRRIAMAMAMAVAPMLALADETQERNHAFGIGAGTLDDVLQAFIRQSGAELLYPAELANARRSQGVSGTMSDRDALDRLLRSSNLTVIPVGAHRFVLRADLPPPTTPPRAAPVPATAIAMEPVDVTGTHIRRSDTETASPVTVITREQIDRGGYQTLYEVLRTQPGVRIANAGVGVADVALFQNNGLTGATGAASVDMRGLGSYATLVLVDGQRQAAYGLADDDLGTVTDLNAIPLAMVDHVDILRDGASAIYGSDAMAGVINIVLRKKADGVRATVTTGMSARGDALQRRVSASIGGHVGVNGHVLLAVDSLDRQPTLGRDRAWSHSTQASPSTDSTEAADVFYLDNAQIRSQAVYCTARLSAAGGNCVDASSALTSVQTEMHHRSIYLHADQSLDDLQVYTDVRTTSLKQRQQTSPVKYNVILPASHPDNPYDEAVVLYGHRFDDLGPVRDITTSDAYALTAGVRAPWGDGEWHVEANEQHGTYRDGLSGLLQSDVLTHELNDGTYRLNQLNDPVVLAALSPPVRRIAHSQRDDLQAQATRPVAQLAGGALTVTAGMEASRDRLDDRPDALITSDRIFQFVTPGDRAASRWTASAYVEADAPLTSALEAGWAARLDRTQGYGNAFSPKATLRWRITPTFIARATWARGYRAPTTLELTHTSSPSPAGFLLDVPDALLPCRILLAQTPSGSTCYLQMTTWQNKALKPETSHSHTLGFVWEPSSSASLALDYFAIRRRHEIDRLPLSYALVAQGAFPQAFDRDSEGELVGLRQQLVNLGHTDARSIDLDGDFRLADHPDWGLDLTVAGSYLWRLDKQSTEGTPVMHMAGYASQPRWTGLSELTWRMRRWTFSGHARYTGSYRNATSSTDPLGCVVSDGERTRCRTPGFILADIGAAWHGIAHWTFSIDVHNVFDHAPVYYGSPGIAYNPLFDDVVGRSWLFSASFGP